MEPSRLERVTSANAHLDIMGTPVNLVMTRKRFLKVPGLSEHPNNIDTSPREKFMGINGTSA